MRYLAELYKHSEEFQLFTQNAGVGTREIKQFNTALQEMAPFHATTMRFIEVLAENKRLVFIDEIAAKYIKLYSEFNKEEKITIISAESLDEAQQNQVLAALKTNPANEGKAFTIEYQVDATILGGLQMYTESEFMDMSLVSRINNLKEEITRICN
jgi:F-type H+-transporting ATPase subunit O